MNPGKIRNSRLTEIKILLDSVSSGCLVKAKKIGKIKTMLDNTNVWGTAAGHISTMKIARLQLKVPEFSKATFINYDFQIFESDIKYDMIIGQDLMRQLGIKIDFETDEVQWRDFSVLMKPINCTNESFLFRIQKLWKK